MFEHWWSDIIEFSGKIFFVIVCASVIGIERERQEKAAGLRTHILICLGACLFTMIGVRILAEAGNTDIMRIIQGIVTGVGFVGAGAIIRQGGAVKGLTTAAGVWVVAAIGIAIAVNQFLLAAISTIFVLIVVHFIGNISFRIEHSKKNEQC